jgi:hypothetical protein
MWLRVFASLDGVPDPAGIESCLEGAVVSFVADESGWYRAEIRCGEGSPVTMERYLADEEGIRAELNAWAAYLETLDYNPNHTALMERAIQTRQLITVRKPIDHSDEARVDRLCGALARHLANVTGGFYQIDNKGFYSADGELLVEEY